MAWVEAATVYDLRVLVDRVNPYQPNPLPIGGVLGRVELVREAATLVMLLTLGALAGRTGRSRLAYSAIAFGVWDIFYYVFLRAITGWPTSLARLGRPLSAAAAVVGACAGANVIAVLLVVWGTFATQASERAPASAFTPTLWALNGLGMGLALYVFMADAIRTLPQGLEATTQVLPTSFNWPLFGLALVLMVAPGVEIARPSLFLPDGGHRIQPKPASGRRRPDQGVTEL